MLTKVLVFSIITTTCVFQTHSQNIVNRVRVRDHRKYMIDVMSEVMKTVEDRGWWNLHLLDFNDSINETIFNERLEGTVVFKNGFLVSAQNVVVLDSSLNQIWTVVTEDATTRVELRGQLRFSEASLGYDIEVDKTNGEKHVYTGVITHPLVTFDFSVFRNVNRHNMSVTITGNQQILNSRRINILPQDQTSDVLTSWFVNTWTLEGIRSWTDIFLPLTEDVITNRIPFPGLCYNCAA